MNTCAYTFVQTQRTTPGMNHNVNYGLGMVMMCQCVFISCDNGTVLVGVTDNGGSYARMQTGNAKEISIPSSQFCYEHKTARKIQFFKKY